MSDKQAPRDSQPRPGEVRLADDPAAAPGDASVVFIGRVRSPWTRREDCPKNMSQARERGGAGRAEVAAPFRAGLAGLERFSHVVLLTWFDRAGRDLIVQHPKHAAVARGVFALRSPVRPNPIGMHVARLEALDAAAGVLHLDAIDVLDGTPLLDIKPYFASIDAFPEAARTADDGRR